MNDVINNLRKCRIDAILNARYFDLKQDQYYVVLPAGALELVLDEYWGLYSAKFGTPTPTTKAIAYATAVRTKDGQGSRAKSMRCAEYWRQQVVKIDALLDVVKAA